MRIGYLIDTNRSGADTPEERRRSMKAMLEEGVIAERAGFHSVQVPDRHVTAAVSFPGPEQLLTLLAHATDRVALGTFTFVATLTHPMRAAEQFSVIDNLSGGRLFTTLSRGFLPMFWNQYGIPQDRLLGRFLETVRIWEAAMAGSPFSFTGNHWSVQDGVLSPPPYQEGGWPIWGGGNSSVTAARRCAEYAACWTADAMPFTAESWETHAGGYREHAHELGKRPFVVLMRDGWVADTFEEAATVFGAHYAKQMRFYVRNGLLNHRDIPDVESVTPKRLAAHLVMGTPAQCVEQLERYHEEFGVDYVTLCCRVATGPDASAMAEQIQRLGEEVVGPIHRRYPAPEHPAIPAACRW
jgi:alkanesulfonate monooxygenase SsuD/methylene tetrahydromethanopterin reductase-like flavin-dependent oxidoreductase (luciferase family)